MATVQELTLEAYYTLYMYCRSIICVVHATLPRSFHVLLDGVALVGISTLDIWADYAGRGHCLQVELLSSRASLSHVALLRYGQRNASPRINLRAKPGMVSGNDLACTSWRRGHRMLCPPIGITMRLFEVCLATKPCRVPPRSRWACRVSEHGWWEGIVNKVEQSLQLGQ